MTVVVDFSDLGGGVVVRCAGSGDMNGLQALDAAGFTLTGTQRQGLAFICRINGRPAADEKLATDGNPDYTEQCVDTPPGDAYWAYWYATDGGSWKYSTSGPSSHRAVSGGYEGWRFELNRSGSGLAPGYQPVTTPTSTPTKTPTETSAKTPVAGTSSGSPAASSSSTPAKQSTERGKRPQRRTTAPAGSGSTPSATPSPSVEPLAAEAPGQVPVQASSAASPAGTLVALALIGGLALAGGGVAWRRSRRP